jgi:fucose permease
LEHPEADSADEPVLGAAVLAKALAGLLISGLLVVLPGALLPVWRHNIDSNYLLIGLYFLVQNIGMLLVPVWAKGLLRRAGLARCMSLACALAVCGLAIIALFSPPSELVHWSGRAGGLLLTGTATGLMNMAVFRAASPAYKQRQVATLNLGGVFIGVGCLLSALVVAGSYSFFASLTMGPLLLILPAVACVMFARAEMANPPREEPAGWTNVARELRSPSALLLALLLFFECGNEGAIAGWLPLFLTQKLGFSPSRSLFLLALYLLALLAGRLLAQFILPRVRHARMLFYSVLLGMFGCLVLAFTDNLFGAISGALMCGLAFSCVLPLALERIGSRFSFYHSGFYNGIFSIAITGGLLAPASIGLYAHWFGINVVMAVPLVGSVLVLAVVLLIFLEARFSAAKQD